MPSVQRKPGTGHRCNPKWVHGGWYPDGVPICCVEITQFELKMQQLGLAPEQVPYSVEMRNWCYRNRRHRYVPEVLLRFWGIYNDDVSDRI